MAIYDNQGSEQNKNLENEIEKINKKIPIETVVTFKLHTTVNSTQKVASYPSGFTKSNSLVVGGSHIDGDGNYSAPLINMTVILRSDGIYAYLGHQSVAGCTVKILLKKIS